MSYYIDWINKGIDKIKDFESQNKTLADKYKSEWELNEANEKYNKLWRLIVKNKFVFLMWSAFLLMFLAIGVVFLFFKLKTRKIENPIYEIVHMRA